MISRETNVYRKIFVRSMERLKKHDDGLTRNKKKKRFISSQSIVTENTINYFFLSKISNAKQYVNINYLYVYDTFTNGGVYGVRLTMIYFFCLSFLSFFFYTLYTFSLSSRVLSFYFLSRYTSIGIDYASCITKAGARRYRSAIGVGCVRPRAFAFYFPRSG